MGYNLYPSPIPFHGWQETRDKLRFNRGYTPYSTIHSLKESRSKLVYDGVNIRMEEALKWQGTIVYFELYSNKEIDPNDVVDNRTDCESQFNEEFCGEDDLDNLW